ncbi:MAG: hypothetical protein HZC38_10010 [Chloroflexi bacterium]|nr:hypothetical protein [Chloroflexota bacterium]
MTIDELITKTMSEPTLFWAAVGVILQFIQTAIIIVSAVVVVIQIQQFQRESIENKIAGLREALNILETDDFNRVSLQVASGKSVQGIKWRKLLDEVNLVALLIEKKYTDEELLFNLKGANLAMIGDYLESESFPAELKGELKSRYKSALELTERAESFQRKKPVAD